ncbi:MAG: O-antigen ligase family protein, partial [Elusimicrobiales bacterium]|nr:O-antigen ligase family protein [Elusimicrobiales bacterium]
RGIVVGLSLFALTVNLSVTFAEAGVIIAFVALIFKYIYFREELLNLRKAPLFLPWMIYLGVGVLTSITAFNPARAFGYLPADIIKCWGFFVFFASFQYIADRRKIVNIFILGALVAAVIGLWQVAFLGADRAHAFMHPINFAELLALALAFILGIGIRLKTKKETLIYSVLFALIFSAFILSKSRMAIFGFIVFFGLFTGFNLRDMLYRKRAVILAGFAFLMTAALLVYQPSILNRFKSAFMKNTNVSKINKGPTSDGSANIRIELWQLGFTIFKDKPILGVGPSNVKKVFSIYHPEPVGNLQRWGNLHSLYIHQLAERGIIGLGALLFLFGSMFALAWKNFRKSNNEYSLAVVCFLPGFFVMNLTQSSFQHAVVALSLLFALGVSCSKENS